MIVTLEMLLVHTSSRHWLRLRFKQRCIQFVRFATLYSYLAIFFNKIAIQGTPQMAVD